MDLKVKRKTIKLLENNVGENLWKLGVGEEFLDLTLKPSSINRQFDKMDLIKIQNLTL